MRTIILFIFFFHPWCVWAASPAGEVNAANRLFKQGKYDQSLPHYQKALEKDGDSALVHYNLGTALVKKGDYTPAVEHLRKAAGSKLKQLTTQPLYNLGNALYKLGMSKENTDIDGAMTDLGQSLANYEQVINMDAKDQDARYNYQFVQKELERLKKKQTQQKQQQKQGQGKQDHSGQQQSSQDKQSQAKENKKNKSSDQSKGQGTRDEGQGDEDQKQQQQAQAQGNELSYKEAKDILEDYQRNEEPKGLLNFIPKDKSEKPVAKDW